MKKGEEREVPDPWESIEEVLEVVLKVLKVFLEVSYRNPEGFYRLL